MVNRLKFYIDGAWVAPHTARSLPVVNPATEEPHDRMPEAASIARGVAEQAKVGDPRHSGTTMGQSY